MNELSDEIALELGDGPLVPFGDVCLSYHSGGSIGSEYNYGLSFFFFFLKTFELLGAVSFLGWGQQCCFWWLEPPRHLYQLHTPTTATKPTQSHDYAPKDWCGFSHSFPGVSERTELDWKSWVTILRLFMGCNFICGNSWSHWLCSWLAGSCAHSGAVPTAPSLPAQPTASPGSSRMNKDQQSFTSFLC